MSLPRSSPLSVEYSKHLSEPWFSYIRNGLKTCEGRLRKGDFIHIQPGDIIHFHHLDQSFRVQVTSLQHYPTFMQYLQKEGLPSCLPGINTFQDGCNLYRSFYSEHDELYYGVVAIHFTLL